MRMVEIKWRFKECLRKNCQYGYRKPFLVLLLWSAVLYSLAYFFICGKLLMHDLFGKQRPKFLCVDFQGGLANHMFQYAFAYSTAKKRNLQVIIDKDNMLTKYFRIKPNTWEDYGYNSYCCFCFWTRQDSVDCGYDDSFEKLPHKDLSFDGYFQSWKYWIDYEQDIRKSFTFNQEIVDAAFIQLRYIMSEKSISVDSYILVGVHIRNGDYSQPRFARFGYNIPPASYLQKAFQYFKNRFKKTLFIVCTNDLQWTKEVLSDEKDYYIVKGNPAAVDMALLSMTNHTIMTVGTFGWMIGWLTKGTTVHYKYPYVEGSRFAAEFHSNNSDHFYPGWISMA